MKISKKYGTHLLSLGFLGALGILASEALSAAPPPPPPPPPPSLRSKTAPVAKVEGEFVNIANKLAYNEKKLEELLPEFERPETKTVIKLLKKEMKLDIGKLRRELNAIDGKLNKLFPEEDDAAPQTNKRSYEKGAGVNAQALEANPLFKKRKAMLGESNAPKPAHSAEMHEKTQESSENSEG